MALVLPLLLLTIFGIIDFGRMLNTQISLTEAAREGAHVASLGIDPTDRVRAIAGDDSDIHIETSPCGDLSEDADVRITYPFTFVTPVGLLGGGFDGQVTLTGHGRMPCQ